MVNLNLGEVASMTWERNCNMYNAAAVAGARRTVSRGKGHVSFRILSS